MVDRSQGHVCVFCKFFSSSTFMSIFRLFLWCIHLTKQSLFAFPPTKTFDQQIVFPEAGPNPPSPPPPRKWKREFLPFAARRRGKQVSAGLVGCNFEANMPESNLPFRGSHVAREGKTSLPGRAFRDWKNRLGSDILLLGGTIRPYKASGVTGMLLPGLLPPKVVVRKQLKRNFFPRTLPSNWGFFWEKEFFERKKPCTGNGKMAAKKVGAHRQSIETKKSQKIAQ